MANRTFVPLAMLGAHLVAAAVLSGCRSEPTAVDYARLYPGDLKQSQVLDVQVFRHTHDLEFTNTSAKAFGQSTLWINERFSKPIGSLAVGETLKIPLSEFRDEFSIPFRSGGFFATEAPDRLVLAQIEVPSAEGKPTLYGLVVIGGRNE
jgi:hypothetical protein